MRFWPRLLSAVLFAAVSLAGNAFGQTKPYTSRMLGGDFVDLTNSAIAYITFQDASCSGTLVGPQEVLTAAHCIDGNASDYTIAVGGVTRSASAIYYNGNYDPFGNASPSNSQFDLGMIILSSPVTTVGPIAVATSYPLFKGLSGRLYGFGLNELEPGDQPAISGKSGKLLVSSFLTGMFGTRYADTGVTVCAGDSGGPVISTINDAAGIIGVVSTGGSGETSRDICTIGDGASEYVNLQTAASAAFLSNFPNVAYTNTAYSYVRDRSSSFQRQLSKTSKSSSLAKIKKFASTTAKSIARTKPYADAQRLTLLNKAIASLKKSAKNKKRSSAAANMRSAAKSLKQLVALGAG